MNEGELPENCPNCGKHNTYDYEDIQIEGNQAWQEIQCNQCGTKFNEIYVLKGWENLGEIKV